MENITTATAETYSFNGSLETEEKKNLSLNFSAMLIIPIILLVAMGNVLVILAVAIEKNLRSATNCFLSSLAVADLLVALMVMPPSLAMIINNYKWPFNDDFCGVWVMLDVLFSTSSILHLCMLSFDRYMALARPFHHRRSGVSGTSTKLGIFSQNKPKALKRVARRIAFVWTLAFGIALPIPIMGKIDRSNLFYGQMCTINLAEFQLYGSLAAFFMPLVFMFIMYTLTIKTLRQQAHMVSNLLVYNGRKSSPFSVPNKTRFFRRSSVPENTEKPSKSNYAGGRFQRRKSSTTVEDNESTTNSISSSTLSPMLSAKNRNCSFCSEEMKNKSIARKRWSTTFRPFIKTARRLKLFLCVGKADKNVASNNRCTCSVEKEVFESKERRKSSVRSTSRFQRNYRSSVRRISSSFKNKAMTSITSEQRASKVLGLIFVLFCLFWCPFFFTNVLSRLCLQCDQELIGELMNWFVWVGYVSSGVNPCVYTLFSRRFRRTFYLLICCKFPCSHQREYSSGYARRGSATESFRCNTKYSKPTTTTAGLATVKDIDEVCESGEGLSSPLSIAINRDLYVYEKSSSSFATIPQSPLRSDTDRELQVNPRNLADCGEQLPIVAEIENCRSSEQKRRYRRNNSVEEFLQESPLLRSIVQDYFSESDKNDSWSKPGLNGEVSTNPIQEFGVPTNSLLYNFDSMNSLISKKDYSNIKSEFNSKKFQTFVQESFHQKSFHLEIEEVKVKRQISDSKIAAKNTPYLNKQSWFGSRRQSC